MSRLLQALKNLEAKPTKTTSGRGLLAHLADKYRAPSPDPPNSSHAHPNETSRPSPIKPQPLDNPLAYLSAGLPTIQLQPPPVAPPPVAAPSFTPAPAATAISAPEVSLPPPLALHFQPSASVPPPATAVTDAESTLRAMQELLDDFAPADNAGPAPPPVPPPKPRATVRPAPPIGQPTLLERAVRRTLAEPQRSEAVRQLADRLKSDLDQVAGRSILISGVGPASETHEVILQAAAVLAEAGEPILVIDGDAAGHTLTNQLELRDGTGLAELAHGEEPDSDPIRATSFDNLSVLPMGKVRLPDPAAVANRLAAIVQSLEESYRLVIIDGGHTGGPAAPALARLCDATYFVVRLGETEAAHAQFALRDFRAAGARLLGCIATS
jgi:Mrp family chromosome partitioning ATPase